MVEKKIKAPLISVVIPTYNRANDLSRCLDSLIAQDFQDYEVLICDDGSTDNTAAVVQKYLPYLDITYSYGQNFGGPARPRNRGLAIARAPYVAFLDSDDWWAPEKLSESLTYLDQGADFVYHDLYSVKSNRQKIFFKKARCRALKTPAHLDLLTLGNGIMNSSVVLRKNLLLDIGGFSEDLDMIAGEDYDAWLRVAKKTEKFVRIDRTLGFYWAGGGNISNPRRTLKIAEKIEARYTKDVNELFRGNSIHSWLTYAKGCAHFHLKNFILAEMAIKDLHWDKTPFHLYLKAQAMLLMIRLSR